MNRHTFALEFFSEATLDLGRRLVQYEQTNEGLLKAQSQTYETIMVLQDGEMTGKNADPEALARAQKDLVSIGQKVEVANRAMGAIVAVNPQLPKLIEGGAMSEAITADLDALAEPASIRKLEGKLGQMKTAASERLALAGEIVSFLQAPSASGLQAAKGALAAIGKAFQKIEADPQSTDFRNLEKMVDFLKNVWTQAAPEKATSQADWLTRYERGQVGKGVQNAQLRRNHAAAFVRMILAETRRLAGVEAPKLTPQREVHGLIP